MNMIWVATLAIVCFVWGLVERRRDMYIRDLEDDYNSQVLQALFAKQDTRQMKLALLKYSTPWHCVECGQFVYNDNLGFCKVNGNGFLQAWCDQCKCYSPDDQADHLDYKISRICGSYSLTQTNKEPAE